MLTLLGVTFCNAQEGSCRSNHQSKIAKEFIQSLNSEHYLLAAMQTEQFDFDYYGDSIDAQLDFKKLDSLILYVEELNLVSQDTYDKMWSYKIQSALHVDKESYDLDYVERLFLIGYDAFNMERDYCELTEIWDVCYEAYVYVKEKGLIPDNYFLNEASILRYAISSYVWCGVKHKWAYEFDEAEASLLIAIDRNNERKKFTSESIEALGNIEQFLIDCRKMRLEVVNWGEVDDIFNGDEHCELCTPFQRLVSDISTAAYYKQINNIDQCVAFLHEAHNLFDIVDSLPNCMKVQYYSLCLSIRKDSATCSFISNNDISKAFSFLYAQDITLADSLRFQMEYANSLIPNYMQDARKIIDSVGKHIDDKEERIIEYKSSLKFLYLTALLSYNLHIRNRILSTINDTQMIDSIHIKNLDSLGLSMFNDLQNISSMWESLKEDTLYQNDIDVQYKVPAIIIMLSSSLHAYTLCPKWALHYLHWKKPYLSKYISLIPESQRDVWLAQNNLNADFGIYEALTLFDKDKKHQDIINALYDNELLTNELLLRCGLSVKRYIVENDDRVTSTLYNYVQQLKTKYTHDRLSGYGNISLLDSILQIERVLSETTREFRVKNIIQEAPQWENIRKKLHSNEIAIEFVSFGEMTDRYGAFVLRKSKKKPIWVELSNPFFTEQSIDELHPYFQSRAQRDKYGYYLNIPDSIKQKIYPHVYNAIWKPLSRYLRKNDIVYYAPKGMLNYIPLHSVIDEDSVYLCDKYDLRVVSSTGILMHKNDLQRKYNEIVSYGDIIYDESFDTTKIDTASIKTYLDRGRVQYLPYSKKEIISIASICKEKGYSNTIFSGANATEESTISLSEKEIGILHFATHTHIEKDRTLINPSAAMDKVGLCLYNANHTLTKPNETINSSRDGILTASEVSVLDLSNTDLVVLSACNTGLGDITNDGVAGLQRGFKMAGVNSILMSLWPVDDAATYLLMTEFYRNYLDGKTKIESLREAQHYLRNYEQDGEKIFDDPKYWAAFILLDALD